MLSNTTCNLNCSAVTNSTGPGASGDCACIAKFLFAPLTSLCFLDCQQIENTDVTGGIPQPDNMTCICSSGYLWNASTLNCDFDCSSIDNNNGTDGSGGCRCNLPYSFIGGNPPKCDLNCSLVANSTTSGLAAGGICACDIPLVWNSTTLICGLDCSVVIHQNGAANASACNCLSPYVWNSVNTSCTIDCINITGATGTATDIETCECDAGLIWNPTSKTCEINCFGIPHAVAPTDPTLSVNQTCPC